MTNMLNCIQATAHLVVLHEFETNQDLGSWRRTIVTESTQGSQHATNYQRYTEVGRKAC